MTRQSSRVHSAARLRFALVAAMLALAACGAKPVRVDCEGRLEPINAPAADDGAARENRRKAPHTAKSSEQST